MTGDGETPPPGSDPDRHLEYRRAALTVWAYDAAQVTLADRVDAPGVILEHGEDG